MTKKHYKLIAEAINGALQNLNPEGDLRDQHNTLFDATQRMADRFERDNALFNRKKFYDACGFKEK